MHNDIISNLGWVQTFHESFIQDMHYLVSNYLGSELITYQKMSMEL